MWFFIADIIGVYKNDLSKNGLEWTFFKIYGGLNQGELSLFVEAA